MPHKTSWRKISQGLEGARDRGQNVLITLKFGRRLGSISAEKLAKFQNNWKILTTDFAPSRLSEILVDRLTISWDGWSRPYFWHYSDVTMSAMVSQISGISTVYPNVCSGVHQRKHQSYAPLAFVSESTGDWWIHLAEGQWRGKSFLLMTSSWKRKQLRDIDCV